MPVTAWLAWALWCWVGEVAAPQPPAAEVRERIEVTRVLDALEDATAFATVLDAREARERGEDLADILRRVPGARVRDYGGLGSYATLSLRASTAEQVAVYVDGLPENRALGGPVDLSFVPAGLVQRITVFRGFGPAALDLGGLGGVVDVRTRGFEEEGGAASVLGGGLGTRRLSAATTLPAGERLALALSTEWLASEGDFLYLDTNGTEFDHDDDRWRRRTHNGLRFGSWIARARVEGVAAGALELAARFRARARELPGVDGLPAQQARFEESLADLRAAWSGAGRIELSADAFVQRAHLDDRAGELGVGLQDERLRLRGGRLGARWRGRRARGGWFVGLEARGESVRVRDEALEVTDRGGASRLALRATWEDVATRGRWTLAPALRAEWVRDAFLPGGGGTLPPPAPDRGELEWTGKLGAAWTVSARQALRGSVGRFHRVPSLLERFGDRGSVLGNPALLPETGVSAELGWVRRGASGRVSWSAETVAFWRRVRDLIWLVPNSQATAVYRNLAAADVRGLELSGTARLGRDWSFEVALTAQRARDRSAGVFRGRALPYQPERLAYAGSAWERGRLRLRWDLTYVGPNATDRTNTPERAMPERWVHDAHASWKLGQGWHAGLDVRNLFDRKTRDLLRYPLPGRVVLLQVGWEGGAARR